MSVTKTVDDPKAFGGGLVGAETRLAASRRAIGCLRRVSAAARLGSADAMEGILDEDALDDVDVFLDTVERSFLDAPAPGELTPGGRVIPFRQRG